MTKRRPRKKWRSGEENTLVIPPIYCSVIEMELPDLDHGCSPECACLVKKETDHEC